MKTFSLTQFTPAEAEIVSGVSTTMQRDWRRHGYLPKHVGHARFDAFEIAALATMKMLSDRGIGPQISHEVADVCATGIVFYALGEIESYEGDHEKSLLWRDQALIDSYRSYAEIKRKEILESGVFSPEGESLLRQSWEQDVSSIWPLQSEWLQRQIVRNFKGGAVPARYFVWFADNTHIFHESLDKAFDGFSVDPKFSSAVIVLDLHALSNIFENLKRSLVHVQYETDFMTGKPISPSEIGATVPFSNDDPSTD